MRTYYENSLGRMVLGDGLVVLGSLEPASVDLIVTSPPFGLVRKKGYGNVDSDDYVEWFRAFGRAFRRVLKEQGSLVIDIGGSWIVGQPTRSLYHFKLLIMLCDECGFHLAQDLYWWNPSRLPTPAEWVTVRRIRAKDAVNAVWWLSPCPWPKASNRRVLQPYSPAMLELLDHGYKAMKRPSGHEISEKFNRDNGAAIPPNLIAIANTESNSFYLRYCKQEGIKPHPARYPAELPEFFIRMLTDAGDLVVDPFAGSCVTGEVCQRLNRRWICVDSVEDYLHGALARFPRPGKSLTKPHRLSAVGEVYYRIPRPGLLWNCDETPLPKDGGKSRPHATRHDRKTVKEQPSKSARIQADLPFGALTGPKARSGAKSLSKLPR